MAAVDIKPNRVLLSNGYFDSDKRYLQVANNGVIHFPLPTVTVSYTGTITLLYKNGIGGVPALYSGANPIAFRADT